jgi:hypothetical protein
MAAAERAVVAPSVERGASLVVTPTEFYTYPEPVVDLSRHDLIVLRSGERVAPWRERLAYTNHILATHGLDPLHGLGDWRNQEFELLHIYQVFLNRFYGEVVFTSVLPDGNPGYYSLLFNRRHGGEVGRDVVVLPLVLLGREPYIVCVRQHRPALLATRRDPWTTELPRCFAQTSGRVQSIGMHLTANLVRGKGESANAAAQLLARELSPLVLQKIVQFADLTVLATDVSSNTGVDTVAADHVLALGRFADGVTVETLRAIERADDGACVPKRKGMSYRFHPVRQVLIERAKTGIVDGFSFTALLLFQEQFRALEVGIEGFVATCVAAVDGA